MIATYSLHWQLAAGGTLFLDCSYAKTLWTR